MSIPNDLCNDHDEIASEFTFVWKISNFSFSTTSKGKALVSPQFQFQGIGDSQKSAFQLIFYPRGYIASSVVCYLKSFPPKYWGKIKSGLCVCDVKQQLYKEEREINFNGSKEESFSIASFGREMFDKLSEDAIVLHCHLGKMTSIKCENRVHCFSETRLSLRRKIFNWKVENFSSLELKKEKNYGWLAYPSLNTDNSFLNTTLKLFLSGTDLKDAAVQIWLTFDGLTVQTLCSCALFIMDENEKVVKNIGKTCWLGPIENIVKFLLKREEIIRGLSTNSLVIRGEMNLSGDNCSLNHVVYGMNTTDAIAAVMGPLIPEIPIESPPSSENLPSALSADMLSLYKGEGPPSDFELRVAGRSFPVHQAVLGARSTVFRAMFSNDMLETSKRSVKLTDIDADTAKRMLLYAYGDQEPSPDLDRESVVDLYAAADKYDLSGLKKVCGDRLSRGLDVDTAPRLLQIADRHADPLLKKRVVDYVIAQGPVVMESENWKKLVHEDPKLAVDVMQQVMKEKWM